MTLSVSKDPKRRRGGRALIRLPAGVSDAASLVIRKDDRRLCLGPSGWQESDHVFGPYEVEESAQGPVLRVGPEIVDHIDAFEPVEITAPELGITEALSWPEDILPSPGAASGGGVAAPAAPPKITGARSGAPGGIGGGGSTPSRSEPPAVEPPPPPAPPSPEPLEPTSPPAPPAPPEPPVRDHEPPSTSEGGSAGGGGDAEEARSRMPLILALVALLALAAAGAWWFTQQGRTPIAEVEKTSDSTEEAATSDPAPTETAMACEADAIGPILRAAEPDAEALREVAEVCREAGVIDRTVQAMDALKAMGDPEALLWFARQYDPVARPPDSPFASDAGAAAEFYGQAAEAGAEDAAVGLDALCARLRGDGDPISKVVVQMNCD